MLSPVIRQTEMVMACHHHEWHTVKYRGKRDLVSIKASYRLSLCADCCRRLSGWAELLGSGNDSELFPVRLPELRGQSESQIKYAMSVRDRQLKSVSPLLFALLKDESDLAIALWRGIIIRLMITSSPYWLSNKKGIFLKDLIQMATDVMKPPATVKPIAGMHPDSRTAYQQLRLENPTLLERALALNPIGMFDQAHA